MSNEPCLCGDPECGRCFPRDDRPEALNGPTGSCTRCGVDVFFGDLCESCEYDARRGCADDAAVDRLRDEGW